MIYTNGKTNSYYNKDIPKSNRKIFIPVLPQDNLIMTKYSTVHGIKSLIEQHIQSLASKNKKFKTIAQDRKKITIGNIPITDLSDSSFLPMQEGLPPIKKKQLLSKKVKDDLNTISYSMSQMKISSEPVVSKNSIVYYKKSLPKANFPGVSSIKRKEMRDAQVNTTIKYWENSDMNNQNKKVSVNSIKFGIVKNKQIAKSFAYEKSYLKNPEKRAYYLNKLKTSLRKKEITRNSVQKQRSCDKNLNLNLIK